MQRKYDIVLLGATGFTGSLMVEYMTATFPGSLRWAIAARNKMKLEEVARKFKVEAKGGSIIVLDVKSEAEIQKVVKSTRVIVNVIGPYPTTCGPTVFKACAENGTDYVDCSADMPWVQDMIQEHNMSAQASGAKMIVTCGLDAVPADLTTYLAVSHIRKIFNTPTREVIVSLQEMKGIISSGTINSMASLYTLYEPGRYAEATAPFAISPRKPASEKAKTSLFPGPGFFGTQTIDGLGRLVKGQEQGNETAIVGRSWGLYASNDPNSTTEGYGPNFHFSARARLPRTVYDFISVLPFIGLGLFLNFSFTRFILTKFIYPVGYSPTPKQLKGRRFSHRTLGVADTGDESTAKRVIVDFKFEGDQYKFTGIAMIEAAVTLLEGGTEAHRLGGGVMTPAMLGDQYAKNLQRPESGVEISTRAEC
ncbi:Saccharopine dehydrogenase domain-containing protein [Trichoderma chlorosporum]